MLIRNKIQAFEKAVLSAPFSLSVCLLGSGCGSHFKIKCYTPGYCEGKSNKREKDFLEPAKETAKGDEGNEWNGKRSRDEHFSLRVCGREGKRSVIGCLVEHE